MSAGFKRFSIRWGIPSLGGAVALLILALLYRDIDPARFFDEMTQAHWGWILVLIASLLLLAPAGLPSLRLGDTLIHVLEVLAALGPGGTGA